jgi:hypothetical protein
MAKARCVAPITPGWIRALHLGKPMKDAVKMVIGQRNPAGALTTGFDYRFFLGKLQSPFRAYLVKLAQPSTKVPSGANWSYSHLYALLAHVYIPSWLMLNHTIELAFLSIILRLSALSPCHFSCLHMLVGSTAAWTQKTGMTTVSPRYSTAMLAKTSTSSLPISIRS